MTTVDHMELSGDIIPLSAVKWVTPELINRFGLYHCDTVVGRSIHLSREYVEEIRRAEDLGIVRRNSDMEIANSLVTLRGSGKRMVRGYGRYSRLRSVYETSISNW